MQTAITPLADWLIIAPVLLPLLGAALLLTLRPFGKLPDLTAILISALVIVSDALLFSRVGASGPLTMTMGKWLPPFGISFTADLMGTAFALAAAFVTFIVLCYLQMDVPDRARRNGLFPLILMLLAGIGGAFLTGDLFNLYVWFEVTLIASFGLIIIGGRAIQLDAAVKYGILNFIATSLFLIALGLLYGTLGTVNMADIIVSAPHGDKGVLAAIGALLLLAFGLKAAAFPVNAWLPATYHAPPVAISALLAGLVTKVGIYALIRTMVLLLPATRDLLEPVLAIIAIATLVLSPLGAIAETNLRRALGFLVMGGIGAILMGIALPHSAGASGSIAYVLHSMLTITALYLVAGFIEKVTGELDSRRMGGLYATSSWLSILFLILVLAISGIPPFLGFWPKLLLLTAGLGQSAGPDGALNIWAIALVAALLINALLTLIAGTRLWAHIFWRPATVTNTSTTKAQPFAAFVVTALWLVVVLGGLFPNLLVSVGTTAGASLADPETYIKSTGLEVAP